MAKIITSFAGFVKLPKFIMGPTCARPGPMLFKVAAMAVKFVTISKPSRLMSRKDAAKMNQADDAYCEQLLKNYQENPDPHKHDAVPLEELAQELGIAL